MKTSLQVRVGLIWLSLLLSKASHGGMAADLEAQFRKPAPEFRPWINWFWMNGNLTRPGITADLEAMQRVGIGGVLIMDVNQNTPPGPIRFGTPAWFEMFRYAVNEATRLGIQINLHNAPGWCGSGGPWINPELAMQRIVWVGTNLVGPMDYEGPLPELPKVRGYHRAVALLAFPTLAGDGAPPRNFTPIITSSAGAGFEGTALLDHDPKTIAVLPAGRTRFIQLEFTNAFTADRVTLEGPDQPQSFEATLLASDNGRSFRQLRDFRFRGTALSLGFATTSARFFRLEFREVSPATASLQLAELELTPIYRLEAYAAKSGLGPTPKPSGTAPVIPPGTIIPLNKILDVTSNLSATGQFRWSVPAGMWTVLRVGHVPTGKENTPPQPEGSGLECDKLSRVAVEAHFAGFLAKLAGKSGHPGQGTFSSTHIDSWEVGYQNWTPGFRQEFKQRRGYDPLLYLPVFGGRIVESVEISERFLWDVRRTIADLVTTNYAGRLGELAHARGLKLSVEAYSSLGGGPFDSLDYGGSADLPMGEFWNETIDRDQFYHCRLMASAAHIYGKPVVAAEAFSAWPSESKWLEHPAALKSIGDAAFCEGVNRFVLQSHALQPWLDRQPGMTFGYWGLHYDRNQTWWEQSQPWHEYLSRCQFMLQRGRFVADVCYLAEEGGFTALPNCRQLAPALPAGHDYDLVSPAVVLNRMAFQHGRLVLPDGMNYRLMVLPQSETMSPELLRRIRDLVQAGATILGSRPAKSPSLSGYPHCDDEVKQLTDELWGNCDGKTVKEHRLGNGKVVWGNSIETVLRGLNVLPDFEPAGPTAGEPLRYLHRTAEGTEIYFVANLHSNAVAAECSFRVGQQRPELWFPESGRIEKPANWVAQDDRTRLKLRLEPAGSLFVVFRESASAADPVIAVRRNGQPDEVSNLTIVEHGRGLLRTTEAGRYELVTAAGKSRSVLVPALPKPIELSGTWEVQFPPNWGAPQRVTLPKLISWSDAPEAGVKYFSGTGTYRKSFELPADLITPQRHWQLDLGRVAVIAQITLNGHNLGVVWKSPFRVDVTSALKPGGNSLEIKVVNLWPNRLIGDEQLPEDCRWVREHVGPGAALAEWPKWLLENKRSPMGRFTFATWKHWEKDSPLQPSGLLGPVRLQAEAQVVVMLN